MFKCLYYNLNYLLIKGVYLCNYRLAWPCSDQQFKNNLHFYDHPKREESKHLSFLSDIFSIRTWELIFDSGRRLVYAFVVELAVNGWKWTLMSQKSDEARNSSEQKWATHASFFRQQRIAMRKIVGLQQYFRTVVDCWCRWCKRGALCTSSAHCKSNHLWTVPLLCTL